MTAADIIARRRTLDGKPVEIDASGLVWGLWSTYTRHAPLPRQAALEVAEAAGMFDAAEIPALVGAAAKLAKGGMAVDFWTLVEHTIAASGKAGTIPTDMPPAPTKPRFVDVAVWTPEESRIRAAGYVVCPKATKRVRVG